METLRGMKTRLGREGPYAPPIASLPTRYRPGNLACASAGHLCYSSGLMDGNIVRENEALAGRLIEACRRTGVRLATAESCTGGLIGATLTAVPGAGDVFEGGIVSYQNRVKEALLGVAPGTLARVGAVSAACAREMALGARRALGADVALAVTGIAGPGGATPGKPVGLVYVAVAWGEGRVMATENHFAGDRGAVRAQTVRRALDLALECLEGKRESHG